MAIQVVCHSCQKKYRLKDEVRGKKFKCKECGEVLVAEPSGAGGGEPQAVASEGKPQRKSQNRRRKKKQPPADPWAAGDDLFGSGLDRFDGNFGEDYPDEDNPYRAPAQERIARQRAEPTEMTMIQLLFGVSGRITRRTYWNVIVASNLLTYGFIFIVEKVAGQNQEILVGLIALLMLPFIIWIGTAVQVKRWHDRDKTGWMVLINVIPFFGPFWTFIECGCMAGTPGDNAYGPEPD